MASRLCSGPDEAKAKDAAEPVPLPETMRAAVLQRYGKPGELAECVHVTGDQPLPDVGKGQLLVRVHAASLNSGDKRLATGFLAKFPGMPRPSFSPGMDLAGEVVRAGKGCERLKVGDAVWSAAPVGTCGAFAEYAVVSEAEAAAKPESLTFAEAASMPTAYITALLGVEAAGVSPGSRGLVLGGTGGVAPAALQIAKARGAAEIACTCAGVAADFAREQGADRPFDYRSGKWWEEFAGEDFDFVLDTAGGPTEESWEHHTEVCPRGVFAATATHDPEKLTLGSVFKILGMNVSRSVRSWFGGPKFANVFMDGSRHEKLDELAQLVADGKVRALVDRTFPLAETGAAFDAYAQSPHGFPRGKYVIEVSDKAHEK